MSSRNRQGRAAGQGGGAPVRLGNAVDTVLKASLGAGVAVLGAYLLQRGRASSDLAERLDRLEALVAGLEQQNGK